MSLSTVQQSFYYRSFGESTSSTPRPSFKDVLDFLLAKTGITVRYTKKIVRRFAPDTTQTITETKYVDNLNSITLLRLQKMMQWLTDWQKDAIAIQQWDVGVGQGNPDYINIPQVPGVYKNLKDIERLNLQLISGMSDAQKAANHILLPENAAKIEQIITAYVRAVGGDIPKYIPLMYAGKPINAPTQAAVNYNTNVSADSLTRDSSLLEKEGTYQTTATADPSLTEHLDDEDDWSIYTKIGIGVGVALAGMGIIYMIRKKKKKPSLKGTPTTTPTTTQTTLAGPKKAAKKTPSKAVKSPRRSNRPHKAKKVSSTIKI